MTNQNKPKLLYTIVIESNKIEFEFNSPSEDEWNISENFDITSKQFSFTVWINNLIDLSDFKELSSKFIYDLVESKLKESIASNIIKTIYIKAKETRLDYLQKININWTKCWIIDNWNDICLMLPEEY